MARPMKRTVEYFPHRVEHHKTMFIIEERYGNDGYALWFKLLERLGATDGHCLDLNDATELEFKTPGCIGCRKCQQSEEFVCAIGDEVAQTVATLPEYDVIVIATPIYWYSYSAQIKIFIDRMYSLSKYMKTGGSRTVLEGKIFALLATGGGPVENNLEILESQWKKPAERRGCLFFSCLFPNTPPEAGTLKNNPIAIEKSKHFGKLLATA